MGNLSEAPSEKLVQCDCCLRVAEEHDLYDARTGEDEQNRICERCQALFRAAEVLSKKDAADEVEIISTLALAAHCGWSVSQDYAHRYTRFEAKGVVEGVPVLRLKSVAADVVRYTDSNLARHVRIEIFSKFARPEHVAEHYQKILASEGLPVGQSSPGSIHWEHRAGALVVDVGPREEIELSRLEHLAAYPQVYRFSFPHPGVVERICGALVGAPRRPGTKGDEVFAAGLGDYDRPRPKEARTLIPACIAWYIGEHEQTKDNALPAKVRRPRIARMLNRYLLKPLNESEIVDDPYSSSDPVWGDTREVGTRFDRVRLFLQADERDFFRRVHHKASV